MNNNSNNCGGCGTTCSECGRPWAICKQDGGCGCNKCKDIKFCEYGRMANGCIREKQPGCPMQAVIPSVTVESIEGIKNLADCLVHVSDINTTFYIDDKHRPIITWAGPVDIPGYDMEGNPNNYRDQIVTDVANQIAVIYDKSGNGYLFGLAENIDLQEQVDNKLDEMAEDGTLQEIISEYLNSTAVFGFDTIADMIIAENLIDGSYAQTTGYATKNDGNGAWYKIRETANDDVVDGNFIIEMSTSDDLVAEKIVSNYDKHNVLNYGADPTGTNDSASAINACIQANKGGTISFAEGVYKVQSAINLPFADSEKVSINGNGAKIITTATMDSLFVGGADRALATDRNNVGFMSYIKDLKIDCSNGSVTNAFYNMQGFKDWHIINCTTYRTANGVKIGDSNNSPSDILIDGCILYGNGSEYDGTGIISNATDNYVQETRIYGFRTGINIASGSALVCDSTHILLRWHDQTQTNFDPYPTDGADFATYYPQTIGVYANGGFRSNNLYLDSVCTSVKVNTTAEVILANIKVLNARTVEQHAIDSQVRDCKMTITGGTFQFKSGNGSNVTGLRCINTNPTFSPSSQLSLSNIVIIGISNLTNPFDLLLSAYPNQFPNSVTMTADTWYLAGVIGNWKTGDSVSVTLNVDGWNYQYRLSATAIQQFAGNDSEATRYTIGTIVSDNNLLICIKSNEAGGHVFSTSLLNGTRNNFNIAPVLNDSVQSSSRLLSGYTASTPSLSNTVYESIGIIAVTA